MSVSSAMHDTARSQTLNFIYSTSLSRRLNFRRICHYLSSYRPSLLGNKLTSLYTVQYHSIWSLLQCLDNSVNSVTVSLMTPSLLLGHTKIVNITIYKITIPIQKSNLNKVLFISVQYYSCSRTKSSNLDNNLLPY